MLIVFIYSIYTQSTSVGKTVNKLRQDENPISSMANRLIAKWKEIATSEKSTLKVSEKTKTCDPNSNSNGSNGSQQIKRKHHMNSPLNSLHIKMSSPSQQPLSSPSQQPVPSLPSSSSTASTVVVEKKKNASFEDMLLMPLYDMSKKKKKKKKDITPSVKVFFKELVKKKVQLVPASMNINYDFLSVASFFLQ